MSNEQKAPLFDTEVVADGVIERARQADRETRMGDTVAPDLLDGNPEDQTAFYRLQIQSLLLPYAYGTTDLEAIPQGGREKVFDALLVRDALASWFAWVRQENRATSEMRLQKRQEILQLEIQIHQEIRTEIERIRASLAGESEE